MGRTIDDDFLKSLVTTLDICNPRFRRCRHGYDPGEVDDFLMRVARDYETLRQRYFAIKSQLEKSKNQTGDESQSSTSPAEGKPTTQATEESLSGDRRVLTQLKETLAMFEAKQDLEQDIEKLRAEKEQLEGQIVAHHAYLSSLNELIDQARTQLRRLVDNATDLLEVVDADAKL